MHRIRVYLVAALLAPLTLLVASEAVAQAPTHVRVMTYNIHHGEAEDGRLDLSAIALPRSWFGRWARLTVREEAQYSYRSHPQFGKACRVYAGRRRRADSRAALDRALPKLGRRERETCGRYEDEAYDGLGPYALEDLVACEREGVELPEPETSQHRELSDAEIARWDARVDAWAKARGMNLADEPAQEIQPWGYALEVDGATVWTDDLVLD